MNPMEAGDPVGSGAMRIAAWICLICLLSGFPCFLSSDPFQEKIKEYIGVVNVQVFVRVLRSGLPLGGLAREDFTLFENQKKVEINGFREFRRRIRDGRADVAVDACPLRLFLLFFWVNESGSGYREVLDGFFRTVYRPADRVWLVSPEKTFEISDARDVEPILHDFHSEMRRTVASRESDMRSRVHRMEAEIESAEMIPLPSIPLAASPFSINPRPQANPAERIPRHRFDFQWMEFRERYLLPSRKRLRAFAEILKPLNLEKWVLVFYQHETYPFRNPFNQAGEPFDPFDELKKRVPENLFFADSIEPAFLAANATFHVLLLPSEIRKKFDSRHFRLEEIHSDWEETFRRIGRATGGDVIEAFSLMESFNQVLEKEDIYYELSFVPNENVRMRRILAVTLNRSDLKDVELFFPRRIEVSDLPLPPSNGEEK